MEGSYVNEIEVANPFKRLATLNLNSPGFV